MLVIYLSNDSEFIQRGEIPKVGDPFPDGGNVMSVEIYENLDNSIALALKEPVTHEPEETFDIVIAEDQSIIRYSWSMIGEPPNGRLMNYEPTNHATLMKPTPSNWVVSDVATYNPVAVGTYKAIYLCHGIDDPLPVAA